MIAWSVVAFGALVLGLIILKYPASNRVNGHPSNAMVGVAILLVSVAAVGMATKMAHARYAGHKAIRTSDAVRSGSVSVKHS